MIMIGGDSAAAHTISWRTTTTMTTNIITFPSDSAAATQIVPTSPSRQSALSVSRHATALEICDLVYSASVPSWEALERFYEPNATYENPLVTATSRDIIADIHTTSAQMAEINVPRPLAVLYALFGMKREPSRMDSWFRLLRAWNESGDVCESESFSECLVRWQSFKTDLIRTCRWTPEGHRRTHAAYPAFTRDTLFFYSTATPHDS